MKKRVIDAFPDFWITQDQTKYRLMIGLWLGVLFIGGSYLWGHFLAWGSASVEFQDWAEVTAPRLTFLRDALVHGELPLNLANPTIIGGTKTYQVLAIPDLLISPQIGLLPFLSVGQFAVFQVLFMFSLGFLGLIQLKRTRQYSVFTFSIVFLLFNFNGNILAHLTVGHLTWSGYFLFPWLILFIFELLEGKVGWIWTLKMALLLFFILLQGSYHQFVWCLFLLGILGLCCPAHFWTLLKTAGLTILLSLVRLLPLVTLTGTDTSINFLAGFPDLLSIWNSLATIQQPGVRLAPEGLGNPIGGWEVTTYVGLIGAVFLVYFGLVRPLMNSASQPKLSRLVLVALGLLLLCFNTVFYNLRDWFPLAIFTGERVITRLFSLVFVLILFVAASHFQEWLSKARLSLLPVAVSGVLLIVAALDLYENFVQWSLSRAVEKFSYELFMPGMWTIANNPNDQPYLTYVAVGAAVTVASLIFLLFMAWREKRLIKLAQVRGGVGG
jgi:hypothetical protein